MSDNRYGGLLDKPMKSDTTAMDAVNRFRDAVNKQRQEEIDKVNRFAEWENAKRTCRAGETS